MSKTASPPVIELRALKKRFGVGDAEHYALNGVDLTVEKGEFIAIMGPSGCGKTTLLNIIGLLDRATDGEYELDGKEVQSVSSAKQSEVRARHIGFVFQNFNLIERMNVLENVALPLTYNGVPHLKRLEMASAMLKKFHLQEREYYMPWQLSGGQSQRVAIARALVSNPSIILADEPTGNLDSKSSHIIMVTHNPDLTTYASRVITMIDGTIATDTNDMKPAKKSPASKRALGKPVKAATKKSVKKPKKKVKKS